MSSGKVPRVLKPTTTGQEKIGGRGKKKFGANPAIRAISNRGEEVSGEKMFTDCRSTQYLCGLSVVEYYSWDCNIWTHSQSYF